LGLIYQPSPYLIDGARGDHGYLSQISLHDSNGMAFASLARVLAAPTDFTISDGSPSRLTGAFAPATQSDLPLVLDLASLRLLAGQISATAQFLRVDALVRPEAADAGDAAAALTYHSDDLAALLPSSYGPTLGRLGSTIEPPVDGTLPLRYGNPLPSRWTAAASVSVSYRVPSLPTPFSFAVLGYSRPAEELRGQTIAPVMTLARELRAEPATSGGGLTLRWREPAQGTPTLYAAEIFSARAAGSSQVLSVLLTDATELPLPASWLPTGEQGLVRFTAISGRAAGAPFRRAVSAAFATSSMLLP
jgi:hypothetical protein